MNISTIKPRNSVLKNYIHAFYILEQSKTDKSDFLIFPSLYPNLSISQNTCTSIRGDKVLTEQTEESLFESFLIANNNKPIHYTYIGKIYEVSISFKPLGINSFFPKKLDYYVDKGNLNHLFFDDFQDTMTNILNTSSKTEAIITLESYLTSKFTPLEHHLLENIMAEFIQSKGDINIDSITKKYGISRQTLNTYFKKYVGRSAMECKIINRFRSASESFFQKTLTDLTYDSNYFDQSHLIKDFKTLTGFTPKQFFKNLDTTNDKHLIWI